jgi:hypothetical protein
MKKPIILLLMLFILNLSGCSSPNESSPYHDIDLQRFVKLTIIEINPEIFYVDTDTKHTTSYQIAKVKVDFHYNDLIVAMAYDKFPYEDDIIDAMITEENLKAINGAKEVITPSWCQEVKMHDEEGNKLDVKGVSLPGREGSMALIYPDENNEKRLYFDFDGNHGREFTIYNRRIKGSGNELYDGCTLDQFTNWFIAVSSSYRRRIR